MSLKLGQTCECHPKYRQTPFKGTIHAIAQERTVYQANGKAVKTVIVRVHSNNRNQPFKPQDLHLFHKASDYGTSDDVQKRITFLNGVEALQRAKQFRQDQLFTDKRPTGANNIEYQMLAAYYRGCLKFWKKPTLKPGFPLLVSTEWAFNKAQQRQKAKSRRARTRRKLFGLCYQVKEVIPF